jgi:hypothetical protein
MSQFVQGKNSKKQRKGPNVLPRHYVDCKTTFGRVLGCAEKWQAAIFAGGFRSTFGIKQITSSNADFFSYCNVKRQTRRHLKSFRKSRTNLLDHFHMQDEKSFL